MRFEPQPNDLLQIGEDTCRVAPHPVAPMMAFGQAGRKSTVYQLKQVPDGRAYALKVFIPAFRGPYIVDIARRIAGYAALPGMAACKRTVLTKNQYPSLIKQYPELEYAVLMPWVADRTWQDIMLSSHNLDRWQSWKLARSATEMLGNLEVRGLAHCDIAGGNVLVNLEHLSVNLVDLEDMYGPDMPSHTAFPAGTAGYQHQTSRTNPYGQWCAAGDRFSGAVLLAEIFAWPDPRIRVSTYGEHFFAESEMQDPACERYRLLLGILAGVSRDIADLLVRAWTAPTLANCPSLGEWARVVIEEIETQQAVHAFESAVAHNRYRQVLRIWSEHKELLSKLPDAREFRQQVRLAQRRLEASKQKIPTEKEPSRRRGGLWLRILLIGVIIAICLAVLLIFGALAAGNNLWGFLPVMMGLTPRPSAVSPAAGLAIGEAVSH
jgi:hypothetical protein